MSRDIADTKMKRCAHGAVRVLVNQIVIEHKCVAEVAAAHDVSRSGATMARAVSAVRP
jgi:hypothetical protein